MTKAPVDCPDVSGDDLAERYVAGRLAGEVREAFEQHYMECAPCFQRVSQLAVVRARLISVAPSLSEAALPEAGTPRPVSRLNARRVVLFGALAASVLLAVSVVSRRPPSTDRAAATTPAAAAPAATATSADPEQSRQLGLLARFEPPVYRPTTMRDSGDEAARAFHDAMQFYQRGQFAEAMPGLSRVAPARVDATFFLAACQLLKGDVAVAIDTAHRGLAFGDTPYRDETRLLLARALLRQGDRVGARRELEPLAAGDGELRQEAMRLLARLASVP